jgi:hypothetical protein
VLALTTREITWRTKLIQKRQNDKIELEAALHGVPLKNTGPKAEGLKLDEEQAEKLDQIINKRMQEGKR